MTPLTPLGGSKISASRENFQRHLRVWASGQEGREGRWGHERAEGGPGAEGRVAGRVPHEIENTRDPGLRQMWTLQLTRWRGFSEPPQGCPEPPAPPLCLFRPPGTHKFSDSVSSSGLTCPEQPSLSSRKPDRSQRSPARNVGTVLGPLSPPPSGHRETLSPDYLSPPSPLPPATHCLPVPAKPPDPRV